MIVIFGQSFNILSCNTASSFEHGLDFWKWLTCGTLSQAELYVKLAI